MFLILLLNLPPDETGSLGYAVGRLQVPYPHPPWHFVGLTSNVLVRKICAPSPSRWGQTRQYRESETFALSEQQGEA